MISSFSSFVAMLVLFSMSLFIFSSTDDDFGRVKYSFRFPPDVKVCAVASPLALSGKSFSSILLLHFEPLEVQPLLDKGEGESRVLVPTISNGGYAFFPDRDDADEILEVTDKFDEDVDIEMAIEEAAQDWLNVVDESFLL